MLGNRDIADIYVVDCDDKAFDPDSVQNILLKPYNGEKSYIELEKLAIILK